MLCLFFSKQIQDFPQTGVCGGGGGGWGAPIAGFGAKTIMSVTDPGFPPGGGVNPPGGRAHTILPNSPKNCMELKEYGCPGGLRPSRPLRSATVCG